MQGKPLPVLDAVRPVDTYERIGRSNKSHSLKSIAGNHKTASAQKASSPSSCPDRTRLIIQRELISKVSDYAPCQTKNPRAEASRARRRENFMGGVSTLPNNPEKGRAVNRKTKNSDRLRDVLNEDRKLNGCMALDGPQKSFIK